MLFEDPESTLGVVTELDRGRLAVAGGFATTTVLLVVTAVAFLNEMFEPIGWRGGEYAYAFIWIALGSAVIGAIVRTAVPGPWRSIGSGMIAAGGLGVLVVIVLVVLFVVAFSALTVP